MSRFSRYEKARTELEKQFQLPSPPLCAIVHDCKGLSAEVLEIQGDRVLLRVEDGRLIQVPALVIEKWGWAA